jgi:sporulation protein YlmC with PRC-barrel domain
LSRRSASPDDQTGEKRCETKEEVMRKLLLTTVFVLPLSVVPALAQDATTPTPVDPATDATTAPMGTEATPATDPAATPADPAAVDAAAEDAEKAAMEAEVAASGKIAQQQAANELRLDWITDATVTAPDGTNIGDINDLIVDGESGQMIAAIIGVGGFLGIGEKQIAVPWDQLTVNYDAEEINSDLTKEEADAASEYVFREREAAPGAAVDMAPAADPAMAPAADPAMAPADPAAPAATMAPAEEPMDPAATEMAPAEAPASN